MTSPAVNPQTQPPAIATPANFIEITERIVEDYVNAGGVNADEMFDLRYGHWFPRGTVSLAAGASGTGKTVLLAHLLENYRLAANRKRYSPWAAGCWRTGTGSDGKGA